MKLHMFDRAKSKYLEAFEDLHKIGDITMSMSERDEKQHEVQYIYPLFVISFQTHVCMYVDYHRKTLPPIYFSSTG